jgi:hypothetical protein
VGRLCEVCRTAFLTPWETLGGWRRRRPVVCTFTNLAGASRAVSARWICGDCLARYARDPTAAGDAQQRAGQPRDADAG